MTQNGKKGRTQRIVSRPSPAGDTVEGWDLPAPLANRFGHPTPVVAAPAWATAAAGQTVTADEIDTALKVELVQDKSTGQWCACVWGRGAAILRPVPGNTAPAHAATWGSEADARAELPALCGCAINVVRVSPAT